VIVTRLLLVVATILLAASGCDRGDAVAKASAPIAGEGATFPAPLYDVWIDRYARQTGAKITYRPTGSGKGIEALLGNQVDFAGSESPLTDEQLQQAGDVLHVPMTIAPVAVAYNAQGVPDALALTPDVLAGIFLGEVKGWNDPRIAALNPGAQLPPKPITVVHRRDGSGTTRVFTEYLSRVSQDWKARVGSGTKVEWPGGGLAADGNNGVSEFISKAPGTIGYVSLNFARAKRLKVAALQNKAGQFVLPSLDGATAAAAGAAAANRIPEDFRLALVEGESADAYPITGFTYILVRREMDDPAKAATLASFLWWNIHHGQSYAPGLHFATLPPEVLARAEEQLRSLRGGGKPVLAQADTVP
jgi:phosphate transport system substrate-binding protein